MEAALNRKTKDFEDYYGLLGCDELSSTEQIINEYKIRALACHPDKHPNDPSAVVNFQKLQEAKEILCNETKRKNFDLWRRSGVTISFRDWQALNDSVKTSMHWAIRTKKEPMIDAAKQETYRTSQGQQHCEEQEDHKVPSPEPMPPSGDHYHQRFRWAGDSPSTLLQRFRNYEI